jgi:hypothetical protein
MDIPVISCAEIGSRRVSSQRLRLDPFAHFIRTAGVAVLDDHLRLNGGVFGERLGALGLAQVEHTLDCIEDF